VARGSLALLILLPALTGCGGSDFQVAAVSGKVTLDGAPLAGAKVLLLPQAHADDGMAGPSSYGLTDETGQYTVQTVNLLEKSRSPGAVVGTHRVAITTLTTEPDPNDPVSRDLVQTPERIPPPYNDLRRSPLRLEVPAEGTDQANFDLETRAIER